MSNTAKLIFPDPVTAAAIQTCLNRQNSASCYEIIKISLGWQVVRVEKWPPAMPVWPPKPIVSGAFKPTQAELFDLDMVTLTLPLIALTDHMIRVDVGLDLPAILKLTSLTNFSRNLTKKTVTFTVPQSLAVKHLLMQSTASQELPK